MNLYKCLCITLFFLSSASQAIEIEHPEIALTGIGFDISVTDFGESDLMLKSGDRRYPGEVVDDKLVFKDVIIPESGTASLALERNGQTVEQMEMRSVPGWTSILPPLVAIALALISRSVIPALFAGVWVGAWSLTGFSLQGLFTSMLGSFQRFVAQAVADPDHVTIMLFTFMIGGMVGVVSRNGGVHALVAKIVLWAKSPRRGQFTTWLLGTVIFFDDYANTLIVGNTARPVTDSLRVSREKLAYIVDSTAAPVATVAVVTTWVGFQIGVIKDSVASLGLEQTAFELFLLSIPYNFYPLLAIFFVLAIIWSRLDFGPMYHAEKRARETGQVTAPDAQVSDDANDPALQPEEGIPLRLINVLLPVLVLVGSVFVGLIYTGSSPDNESAWDIIKNADSYQALMWASLLAVVTAMLLSVGQRILTLNEAIEAWYAGVKFMFFGLIVLVLAWALSSVAEVVHTADFLVSVLGDKIDPGLLPMMIFVLAAMVAFATGSSWGAMGILSPLVLPLTWAVLGNTDMQGAEHMHIFYSSVASVLAGAVWGDHCSPIADTTILSSLASGCDLIDHVKTQLPYALLVGLVGIFLGSLPVGFGLPVWVPYVLGAPILLGVLFLLGKPTEPELTGAKVNS
ncbi:MAG: Na+/H+ antiporter NhaC family protein [Pseudomonadota bacterium]